MCQDVIDLTVAPADKIAAAPPLGLLIGVTVLVATGAYFVGENQSAGDGIQWTLVSGASSCIICALALHFWSDHTWRVRARNFRTRLEAAGPLPLHKLLAQDATLLDDACRLSRRPRPFLNLLCRCARYGTIVRVFQPRYLALPVVPLEVSFEPVMIDQSDLGFEQISRIYSHLEAIPETVTPQVVLRNDTRSRLGRRYRRARDLGKLGILSSVLLVLFFQQLGLIILVVSLYQNLRERSPRSQLWAVPGGLLLPKAGKIFRKDATLVLYNRQSSALALARPGEKPCIFRATPWEVDFALRALLSVAPSPSDEMLSSFIAGE